MGGERIVILKYYDCLTGKVHVMATEAHLPITAVPTGTVSFNTDRAQVI